MMLVTNSAWSPTLLRAEGIEVAQSAIAMATFNFGSVIGTSLAGWLISRLGVVGVLPLSCIGGAIAIGAVGYAAHWVLLVTFLQGLFGLFLGCVSSGLIVLAALFYPTAIRSTGVGWSMGMGRIGSFIGPLVVGALVGASWPTASVFVVVGLPGLVAALTTALRPHRGGGCGGRAGGRGSVSPPQRGPLATAPRPSAPRSSFQDPLGRRVVGFSYGLTGVRSKSVSRSPLKEPSNAFS